MFSLEHTTMTDKCIVCKKRPIILIDCVCGEKMCLKHRYNEFHYCDALREQDNKEKRALLNKTAIAPKMVDKL
jgi:hypothetical protein